MFSFLVFKDHFFEGEDSNLYGNSANNGRRIALKIVSWNTQVKEMMLAFNSAYTTVKFARVIICEFHCTTFLMQL